MNQLARVQEALVAHKKEAFVVSISIKQGVYISQILDPLGKQYFHYVFHNGEEDKMYEALLRVLTFDPQSNERTIIKNNQAKT